MKLDPFLLIPLNSGEFIALTTQEFEQARARGRELMPNQTPSTTAHADDRIVDAEGAATLTGVPASWFLEAARRGDIPVLRFGKYCRFRVSELLNAVSVQRETVTPMRRKSA